MTQAAAILAVLLVLSTAAAGTFLPLRASLAFLFGVSGAAAAFLHLLGSDLNLAAGRLPPLLLIAGYAAVSALLAASGLTSTLASRLGPGPLPMLLLAGTASIFLSNDIVVVALAGVALARESRTADVAALFVGANMTGGLLPQGTPKNLLLLGGEIPFSEYLQASVPATAVLTATAVLIFLLWGMFGKTTAVESGSRAPLEKKQRILLLLAVLSVAAQPAAETAGISRPLFGILLLLAALFLGPRFEVPATRIVRSVPWQLAPAVLVVVAGASLLVGEAENGTTALGFATFFVSSFGTDLTGAALAAPQVASGAMLASVAMAATTAAAYATPIGSVSGILLLQEAGLSGRKLSLMAFALSGSTAVLSFGAAALLLPLLSGA